MDKTDNILYERTTQETKMANFTPRSARQTRSPLSTDLPGKMYAFIVSTCQKNLHEDDRTPLVKSNAWQGMWRKDV